MDFRRRRLLTSQVSAEKEQKEQKEQKESGSKEKGVLPSPSSQSVPETMSNTSHATSPPSVAGSESEQDVKTKEPEKETRASPSRFQRIVQAQVQPQNAPRRISEEDQIKAQNSEKSSASFAEAWGLSVPSDPSVPVGEYDNTVCLCPKCHKESLCLQGSGSFVCLHCSFHGDTAISPRSYRGTWLSSFDKYLEGFSLIPENITPPEVLRPHHPDESVPLPSDVPRGVFAPAFIDGQMKRAWHVFIRDNNGVLRDTHIWRNDDENEKQSSENDNPWFRYDIPAYPWGISFVQSGRVVLVADMRDQLALSQSGVKNVLVVPPDLNSDLPTSEAWRVMEFMEPVLTEKSREIVIAFPNSRGWRVNEEEVGRRLDKERCFRVRYLPFHNDAHHAHEENLIPEEKAFHRFFEAYGPQDTESLVDLAHPFPVAGIHELDDIDEQFEALYETGLKPGAQTGWPSMDVRYTVKTGQWTLVTGIPGHGKSSWLDGLLVNLASQHGWRFGLFSPENQPIERHFASLMEKKLNKPFSEGPTPRISQAEKNQAKVWLNEKFKIILPTDDGLWTLDSVLKLAKTLVMRYGIRGLVIDPWNELDHSIRSNITETTYISECLTKIRRFARLYDIHIWIVAHPTKLEKRADGKYPVPTPYDVSGGAHWRNKADNAIAVYRNVDEDDSDITDVYTQKVRFKEVGSIGVVSLRSDKASGAFIDDVDQNKRALALQQGRYELSSNVRLAAPRQYPKGPPLEYDQSF